jgi:MerR family transcriptional regulator, thiopeptide resistance regulator
VEWSIHQIARAAGTTSRTLRYYGEVGLLTPSRIGSNGYRFYDENTLVRLQRILLLRELGLGIPEITRILGGEQDPVSALGLHLRFLRSERDRLVRRIASVETTLLKLKGGEQLMPQEVFDGFDHTQYREEVIERWGQDAYDRGDRWWNSLSEEEKRQHQLTQTQIAREFAEAMRAGRAPGSDEVQEITRRHVQWLSQAATPSKGYLTGLGEMYVSDPRFAANYDTYAAGTAAFVRDAMAIYAERNYA